MKHIGYDDSSKGELAPVISIRYVAADNNFFFKAITLLLQFCTFLVVVVYNTYSLLFFCCAMKFLTGISVYSNLNFKNSKLSTM